MAKFLFPRIINVRFLKIKFLKKKLTKLMFFKHVMIFKIFECQRIQNDF